MAQKRKVKIPKVQIEQLPHGMQVHIYQLGMSSIEEYKQWCRKHNFSRGINKNSRQLRNELDIVTTSKATELMTDEKKSRNLKDIIPKIYDGELPAEKLRNEITKEIAHTIQISTSPKILFQLLTYIEESSELLEVSNFIKPIARIAEHSEVWIRPLKQWKVKRHNRERQFSDLLRHLFVAYDVPSFMDQVWFSENSIYHNWYIHIGCGQNIRTAPDFPSHLTKKMAHQFLMAPKQYSVEEAIRWGQVHALGGDKRLMDALRGTHLINDFANDDFWMSVIRFFIANPMLDVSHVNPILDFIWNQKFENQRIFVGRGLVEEIDPPQPNFTMKGRTPRTLLRQVNEWHRQLGKETRDGDYQWERSDIGEYHLKLGSEKKQNVRFWHIQELLNSEELQDEGRRMNHCVKSFARSCHAGKISIWSLELEDKDERRKVLTIEVLLNERLIRQVRGKQNRSPNLKEKNILQQWANRENLRIAAYTQFVEH